MSFAFLVKFCCLFVIHLLTKIPRDKLNVSDRADVVEDVLHRLPLVVVNSVGKLVGNDCSRPGSSSLRTLRLGGVGYATINAFVLPHYTPTRPLHPLLASKLYLVSPFATAIIAISTSSSGIIIGSHHLGSSQLSSTPCQLTSVAWLRLCLQPWRAPKPPSHHLFNT